MSATPIMSRLDPHETVSFDPAVLQALLDAHGSFAEEVIAGALFRIEERLVLATWQAENGEWGGLRRTADELARLAREVGMTTLVHAAEGAADAARRPLDVHASDADAAARAACVARLARLSRPGTLTGSRLDGPMGGPSRPSRGGDGIG